MTRHRLILLVGLLWLSGCAALGIPAADALPTLAPPLDAPTSPPAATASATLSPYTPVPSATPVPPTPTSTDGPPPTNTLIPTFTPRPTEDSPATRAVATLEAQVATGQAALAGLPSPTATRPATEPPTATATEPPTPTPTPLAVVETEPTLYYTQGNARVRSCPRITPDCTTLAQLPPASSLTVNGSLPGDVFRGTTVWFQVVFRGRTAYVHSSLLALTPPTPGPGTPPYDLAGGPASPPQSFATPDPFALPGASVGVGPGGWDCTPRRYTCASFRDNATLLSYWNACPRDPSNLDRNADGIPCNEPPTP